MLRASISELTTLRWDLADEVDAAVRYGFEALSIWRSKLSDLEPGHARRLLDAAGLRVSSLQWAGGFTGSDGRTFREGVADAGDAIREAADVGSSVLVVHTGCRGGHTLGHARRLVHEAIEHLAPQAEEHGVTLAIKPTHPAASAGCGFFTSLDDAVRFIEEVDNPAVGLALDLWHFGCDPRFPATLPQLVEHLATVVVADCRHCPSADHERLPPGEGSLPLGRLLQAISAAGYSGDVEFEFFAEPADARVYDATGLTSAGYHEALQRARRAARAFGCLTVEPASQIRS